MLVDYRVEPERAIFALVANVRTATRKLRTRVEQGTLLGAWSEELWLRMMGGVMQAFDRAVVRQTLMSRINMEVVGAEDDAICAIIRSSSLRSLERETAFSVAPDSSTV